MRNVLALLVLTLFATSCSRQNAEALSTVKGGSMGDNGGDTINCRHSTPVGGEPYYEGTYTLDYFLTQDPRFGASDDLEGESSHVLLGRIGNFLDAKIPALAQSFRDYLQLIENADESQARIWKALTMPLTDLQDEGIIQTLPANCVVNRGGTNHADLRQMVRRRRMLDADVRKVFYYYDYEHFTQLREQLPLQYSYLAVHEFLWDIVDSPWVNRSVNRLLHSKSAHNMTADQFKDYLAAMAIRLEDNGALGNVGQQEDPIRSMFRGESLCNYDRRLASEFLTAGQTTVVRPGETKTLQVQFPDGSDQIGPQICGLAMMMNHRSIGGGGATLDVKLSRGIAFAPVQQLSVSSQPSQVAFSAMCRDRLCAERYGELNRLIFMTSFFGSRWTLTLTNRSGTYPVEVRQPYLLFVDMKP